MTKHFQGPIHFVLAGSGHIAGVVNPPSSGKYQYWSNGASTGSFDESLADATENTGSWWPDWIKWMQDHTGKLLPADGARIPGGTPAYPAIQDTPGHYEDRNTQCKK